MKALKLICGLILLAGITTACSNSEENDQVIPDEKILLEESENYSIGTSFSVPVADASGSFDSETPGTRAAGEVDEEGKPLAKYPLKYVYLNVLDGNKISKSLKFEDVDSPEFVLNLKYRVYNVGTKIVLSNGIEEVEVEANTGQFFFSTIDTEEMTMTKDGKVTLKGMPTYGEINDRLLKSYNYRAIVNTDADPSKVIIQYYVTNDGWVDSAELPSILPIRMNRIAGVFSTRLMFTGDFYSNNKGNHDAVKAAFKKESGYDLDDIRFGRFILNNFPLSYNQITQEVNKINLGFVSVCNLSDVSHGLVAIDETPISFTYVPQTGAEVTVEGLGVSCKDAPFLFPVTFADSHRLYFYLASQSEIDKKGDSAILSVYASLRNVTIESNTNNYIYVKVAPATVKEIFDAAYNPATRSVKSEFEIPASDIVISSTPL